MIIWFFFFKQKTAYEMRISDWSSDVCSSDLPFFLKPKKKNGASTSSARTDLGGDADLTLAALGEGQRHERDDEEQDHRAEQRRQSGKQQRARRAARIEFRRSEEETSELKSLMRDSYADLFWTKKTR